MIGVAVLKWSQEDPLDRRDLAEVVGRLATPSQRRLRLDQRWSKRDVLLLDRPFGHETVGRTTGLRSRAAHTNLKPTSRGLSRPASWDLDEAMQPPAHWAQANPGPFHADA